VEIDVVAELAVAEITTVGCSVVAALYDSNWRGSSASITNPAAMTRSIEYRESTPTRGHHTVADGSESSPLFCVFRGGSAYQGFQGPLCLSRIDYFPGQSEG
jgi:hypothetical protein